MQAVYARAVERYEESRRQRLARAVWLEKILATWDSRKHRTLDKFLQTKQGRVFRRRSSIATAK